MRQAAPMKERESQPGLTFLSGASLI